MRALKLLHNFLSLSCPVIHNARLDSLIQGVEDASHAQKLTLTSLGRHSKSKAFVKHKIKRIDRLLGNTYLHTEKDIIYCALASLLIGNKKHPLVLVDWASVDSRAKFQVLKASIAYEGRSITLYDHVEYTDRPRKETNNSHDSFIEKINNILPQDCKPIIVTDAGFTPRWFKRIEKKGWYWIGRVRGLIKMQQANTNQWNTCNDIHALATKTPKDLGAYILSKKNPLECRIVVFKAPKKGRKSINYDGTEKKINPHSDYKKSANEPWVLSTNIPKTHSMAKKVVNTYSKRMQIEETFRDIKDPRCGLGLINTLSNDKERVSILLLIASLVLFVFALIGKAAYQAAINKQFQANTETKRLVLSIWFLGRQVWSHLRDRLSTQALKRAWLSMLGGVLCYENM